MDKRPSTDLSVQSLNPLNAAIGMRLAYWAYEHTDVVEAGRIATYPDAWEHAKPGQHLPADLPVAQQNAEGRLLSGSPEGWNTQHNADGKLENQFKVSINTETREITFDFKGSDAWSNWKSDLGNAGASEFAKIEAKAQAALETLQTDERYKDYRFAATGHSLGGGMAQSFALRNNVDAYVYNSLPIARDTINGDYYSSVGGFDAAVARYQASGRQVHDVRTPNDIATYTFDGVMRNRYLSEHVKPGPLMLPGSSVPPAIKTALMLSGSATLVAGAVMGVDHGNQALFDAQQGLSMDVDGRYRIPEGHAAFARVPPEARKLFAELGTSPVTKTVCTDTRSKDQPFDRFHVQHEDGSQERIAVNPGSGDMVIDHYNKNGQRTLIEMNGRKAQPAKVTEFDAHNRPIETETVAMQETSQTAPDQTQTQTAQLEGNRASTAAIVQPEPTLTAAQKKQYALAHQQMTPTLQRHGLKPDQVAQVCAAGIAHCAQMDQGEPVRFMVSKDGQRIGVLHEGQRLTEMPLSSAFSQNTETHLADAARTVQSPSPTQVATPVQTHHAPVMA